MPRERHLNGFEDRCADSTSGDATTTYEQTDGVLTDMLTAPAQKSPDLATVIRAWPELPEAIRAGIIALVAAARKGEE